MKVTLKKNNVLGVPAYNLGVSSAHNIGLVTPSASGAESARCQLKNNSVRKIQFDPIKCETAEEIEQQLKSPPAALIFSPQAFSSDLL